jgi:Uncharacterized protein conserved in bacteria (DUF2313).
MAIDLERFPTSDTAQRMLSRISPVYDDAYLAKWIYQVMGLELDEVRLRFAELNAQALPETATWGLRYWEQRYGIPVDESADIEVRRRNVLALRGSRLPLNPARMEKRIYDTFGVKAEVQEYVAPGVFHVYLYPEAGDTAYADIIAFIRRIKQSHLSFVLGAVVDESFYREEYCYCVPSVTLSEYFTADENAEYIQEEYYYCAPLEHISEYATDDTEASYMQEDYCTAASSENTGEYFNEYTPRSSYERAEYEAGASYETFKEDFKDEQY